jgi:hypothetical protein
MWPCSTSGNGSCENAANAMSENNDFALVPRPLAALQNGKLGANSILSGMVSEDTI